MSGVSVIIPTFNAECDIEKLLDVIERQTVSVDEILVVDSSSEDKTVSISESFDRVRVKIIAREDFDHGATRHLAFIESIGDYVLFLTQDAVPLSSNYVEKLLNPFKDDRVALVSGRQVPKKDARRFEQLVRSYNYPPESNVRSLADLETLGIKTYFASDVCSAYRRAAYLECDGFEQPCNTNEDMLMAAKFIHAGWKVAYSAEAKVAHSHNLRWSEQYRRNKEVGFFLEAHKQKLQCGSEMGEGGRLAKEVTATLLKEKNYSEVVAFGADCAARLVGNKRGRSLAKKKSKRQST